MGPIQIYKNGQLDLDNFYSKFIPIKFVQSLLCQPHPAENSSGSAKSQLGTIQHKHIPLASSMETVDCFAEMQLNNTFCERLAFLLFSLYPSSFKPDNPSHIFSSLNYFCHKPNCVRFTHQDGQQHNAPVYSVTPS